MAYIRHGQKPIFVEGEGFVGNSTAPGAATGLSESVAFAITAPDETTERPFRFSRLFPGLPKFQPSIDSLAELAHTMESDGQGGDHPTLPAGFTYLGQFIDHDITFDRTGGIPTTQLTAAEIQQGRSPSLDLDSLYGRGPADSPQFYEADHKRLRVGSNVSVLGENDPFFNDIPRGDDLANPKIATIGDPRNDENLAVAQTHLAFIKFHNAVVKKLEGEQFADDIFAEARKQVTLHFQWIVLKDFLPRIIDPAILGMVQNTPPEERLFQVKPGQMPPMPLEFSVAAYRIGHSMIRATYEWNRIFQSAPDGQPGAIATLTNLFGFTGSGGLAPMPGGDLGLTKLPSNWIINWKRFFDFSENGLAVEPKLNHARLLDTHLANPLKQLPEFAKTPEIQSLAFRNLLRGAMLGLPSGQDVAAAIGIDALMPEQIASGPHAELIQQHQFDRRTPLWYYMLKEAEVLKSGLLLGELGSRLVAETFIGLIAGSQISIFADLTWTPTLGTRPGIFEMTDLLKFVGELNPLGD
jgi:hypothetical protein